MKPTWPAASHARKPRYALASLVTTGETAQGAITVFDTAVATHGVPQRLLSDNGLALNPSRRGITGRLVAHVTALGVEPITGKPYKPTTQGKNERFHQTLFRYLDKQPLANSLAELQTQVDTFDLLYNTQRPHQALPGRVTPQQAWAATPKAEPPRPVPRPVLFPPPAAPPRPRITQPDNLPPDTRVKKLTSAGTFSLDSVTYLVGGQHRFHEVLVITDGAQVTVVDAHGEILVEHTRPAHGITYVGNGRPRGPRPSNPEMSPMS